MKMRRPGFAQIPQPSLFRWNFPVFFQNKFRTFFSRGKSAVVFLLSHVLTRWKSDLILLIRGQRELTNINPIQNFHRRPKNADPSITQSVWITFVIDLRPSKLMTCRSSDYNPPIIDPIPLNPLRCRQKSWVCRNRVCDWSVETMQRPRTSDFLHAVSALIKKVSSFKLRLRRNGW